LAPAPAPCAGAPDRSAIRRAIEATVTIQGEGVYGAGVLLAPAAGLILTAEHVVSDMAAPLVTFRHGRTARATVVETDHTLDLALLQVPAQPGRPAAVLGDATRLAAADEVFAVGNPRRLGFTLSRGIVSHVGRPMEGARYVQTDLPINDGNSGGPVLDQRGEVVATMSFILRRAQGLAFALPINYALQRFASRLPPRADQAAYFARFQRWLAAPGGAGPPDADRQPAGPDP
jgi:S1-C subfamily serine protease